MDRIFIRDLSVRCVLGTDADERRERQDVVIGVVLHVDLSAAARSDRIEDTVDYREVKKRVVAVVESSAFGLLETLADRVAETCLAADPRVAAVEVTIDKPGALRFARSVAVEVTRNRG